MEVKIDEKSIPKWNQDGKASWHRFLMDFGGFLEASWEGKWNQDRPKKASKKRWEGKGKEEEGKGLEGKGVEKCGTGLSAGGGRGKTYFYFSKNKPLV